MSVEKAFVAQTREAGKWCKLAVSRKNCGDAFAELILATRNLGVADGLIRYASTATRKKLQPKLDRLESDILLITHELRAKCRI